MRIGYDALMEDQPEPVALPVPVPYTELPADLLHAVVESFVLREGTDYGEHEIPLEDKVTRVLAQLKRGEAEIIFDPNTDSVTILVKQKNKTPK
jgi:hypothetical protein